MRVRPLLLVLALGAAGAAVPAGAHNEGIPAVPVTSKSMVHVQNIPNLSGNALDFFERRQADGSVKRYAVAANTGNGFDVLDVTDPGHPKVVGRYLLPGNDPAKVQQSSAGSNFHAWVTVNPRRNIVALTVEEGVAGLPLGRTVRHGGSVGMQFVDITDVANPVPLGKVDGLEGPHTARMIGDNHVYTSLSTWIVDYTDPRNPKASKRAVEGHEFWEDPNVPGRMYAGLATTTFQWGVYDVRDPANPALVSRTGDSPPRAGAAHEVYNAADSSYVGVADFTSGQTDTTCPGGGVHFYDISGRFVPGASVTAPRKLGAWYAPTTGFAPDGSSSTPNNVSCTLHSWQPHPERSLAVVGLYGGGTYVFDSSAATKPSGGAYSEYKGVRGTTTWGNTVGHVRDAGDYVNAAQWLPFDLADPEHERYVYVNGSGRGLDVYRYTGTMPAKQARLTATVTGGTLTGTLGRYAVLTATGWQQLPLAGRAVEVTSGGATTTVITAADGSFSAPVTGAATVRWAGDDRFAPVQTTAGS